MTKKYTISLYSQQQMLHREAEMGSISTKYLSSEEVHAFPKIQTHVRLTDRGRSRCFMPNSVSDL